MTLQYYLRHIQTGETIKSWGKPYFALISGMEFDLYLVGKLREKKIDVKRLKPYEMLTILEIH